MDARAGSVGGRVGCGRVGAVEGGRAGDGGAKVLDAAK